MDYIKRWCDLWGFKVSIVKISVVLFHRGPRKDVQINFNGSVLKEEVKVKFLGMMFDRKLNWKSHTENLIFK